MRLFGLLVALWLVPWAALAQPGAIRLQPLGQFAKHILDIHNRERASVGAVPLRWNAQLEADATAHAQLLARTGRLFHAPREGRGIARENLSQGPAGWGPDQLMRQWLDEKRSFHAGIYPNVCAGGWLACAHYTQIIWPGTTDVGCGMAAGGRFNWLVCRYSPGGNKDGKLVGQTYGASDRQSSLSRYCASGGDEIRRLKADLEQLKARKAAVLGEINRVRSAIQAAEPAKYDPSLLERLLGTTHAPTNEQLAALSRRLAELMNEVRSIDAQVKADLERLQWLQGRSVPC